MAIDVEKIYKTRPPAHHPFRIGKLGHVVLMVEDLERSVEFYTQLLGFRVSDAYAEEMVPGGMVFLRFNTDHHGVALVGGAKSASRSAEMHHMAFEVPSLEDVFRARAHLKAHGVTIDFEGRRRAACQVAVEFSTRTGIGWKSTGASIRSAPAASCGRGNNGKGRRAWKKPSTTPWRVRIQNCGTPTCGSPAWINDRRPQRTLPSGAPNQEPSSMGTSYLIGTS